MSEIADDLRPWRPEGAREFRVGDRVRIHVSAECKLQPQPGSPCAKAGEVGHCHEFDNRLGMIIRRKGNFPFHPHAVVIDESFWMNGDEIYGDWFAPSELELIEPADDLRPTRAVVALRARKDAETTPHTLRAQETPSRMNR